MTGLFASTVGWKLKGLGSPVFTFAPPSLEADGNVGLIGLDGFMVLSRLSSIADIGAIGDSAFGLNGGSAG
jgi:hypothetical protein